MKRKHLDFRVWEKQMLKNPKFKEEYDKLQPEFAIIGAVIEARIKNDMTQKQLAEKMGTTQSAISRLEKGNISPTVSFLQKLAEATDSRLDIRFLQ
jgi:ribosome-binding protein aMBF1 (putative translation factor)